MDTRTGVEVRFLLENHINHPTMFHATGARGYEVISLYDHLTGEFVAITEPGDHYVRHALRAIASATTRFEATFGRDGHRLPLISLPPGLHAAREFETVAEAQMAALGAFTATYDPRNTWPNATVELAV